MIGGDDEASEIFWNSIRDTDFARNHEYLPANDWKRIIPIGVHGDGGAFNKNDAVYTVAWNSLVASGSTTQTRILFTIIKK